MISLIIESCMEDSRVRKQSCLKTTVRAQDQWGAGTLFSQHSKGSEEKWAADPDFGEGGTRPPLGISSLYSWRTSFYAFCLLFGMQIYFSVPILGHQHSVTLKLPRWKKLCFCEESWFCSSDIKNITQSEVMWHLVQLWTVGAAVAKWWECWLYCARAS